MQAEISLGSTLKWGGFCLLEEPWARQMLPMEGGKPGMGGDFGESARLSVRVGDFFGFVGVPCEAWTSTDATLTPTFGPWMSTGSTLKSTEDAWLSTWKTLISTESSWISTYNLWMATRSAWIPTSSTWASTDVAWISTDEAWTEVFFPDALLGRSVVQVCRRGGAVRRGRKRFRGSLAQRFVGGAEFEEGTAGFGLRFGLVASRVIRSSHTGKRSQNHYFMFNNQTKQRK